MMKKKRIQIASSSILLIFLGGYLLSPLTSPQFEIKLDSTAYFQKHAYLDKLAARPNPARNTANQPNIVLLVADDLAPAEVGMYGQERVPTPNIDAIGKNGVWFTDAYATAALCSPSRAALLTGRYQQRYGYEIQIHDRYPKNRLEYWVFKHIIDTDEWIVADNMVYPEAEEIEKQGLPVSEITLAEALQAGGYATGIFGKWHLGAAEEFHPLNRGFDTFYGFVEAFTLYDDPEDMVNQHHDIFIDKYIWGKGREGTCAIQRDFEVIEEKDYLTTRIGEEASAFIETHRDRPFFAYVPFSAPHTPFQAPEHLVKKFDYLNDKNKQVYYAMIASMDDAIGQIMSTLDKNGLTDNTLVFFISDNGGAHYTEATDNAPFRGGKSTQMEGGIRVPAAMQWPAALPRTGQIQKPVIALDFFTTAIQAAGLPLPDNREVDGINLLDSTELSRQRPLFWRQGDNKAVRRGPWKLVINDIDHTRALFHLENDPAETTNLLAAHPVLVAELEQQLTDWEAGLMDPLWPKVMHFRYSDSLGTYHYTM